MVDNGPYSLLSLNLRGTLYFPPNKVAERRRGQSGTLRFSPAENYFFKCSGFTMLALFRPNAPHDQEHATLLRFGAQGRSTFLLQWNVRSESSRALLAGDDTNGNTRAAVSAPAGSHRRQQWALTMVHCTGANELSISANGVAGESIQVERNGFLSEAGGDLVLEVGGWASEKQTLFYGEVAEIIVFDRTLSADESSSLTRYVSEAHRL